jgi:hypothetical protein
MTPDTFFDRFTDSKYCNLEARPKTRKALAKLCQRIPDGTINGWPQIVVFAPESWQRGSCLPLMRSDPESDDAFIYCLVWRICGRRRFPGIREASRW